MDSLKIQVYKLSSFYTPKVLVLLFLIVIVAGLIRFTDIDKVPVSLYWDEVSSGYNSYSILRTGKDEFGKSFPIVFRAFDDDKMPLNIYLSTIPIKLFGLNEFSVRFTSAVAGTLSILFLFLIAQEVTKENKKGQIQIALLAAFLLALTPWHIIFSRTGFEANVAFYFSLVGTYFFLKALRREILIFVAVVFFAMSFYTYRSSVVMVPLLLVGLTFLYRKITLSKENRRSFLFSLFIFILLISPLVLYWIKSGDVRAQQVSVFNPENVSLSTSITHQSQAGNTFFSKIFFNRRIVYLTQSAQNYMSHFSPNFLFLKGDGNARHAVKDRGLLYIWELPFILAGIFYFYKTNKKGFWVLMTWLLISPVAASLSVPSPHALRSLPMVAPLTIFCAGGMNYLLCKVGMKKKAKKFAFTALLVLITASFIYFMPKYIYHNTVTASADWGDGYKQLVLEVMKYQPEYEKVIITGHYWQPYAYVLFYEQYDPDLYQKYGNKTQFAKYMFGGTSWDLRVNRRELDYENLQKLAGTRSVLVALSPIEYIHQRKHLNKIEEIKDHSGRTVFILSKLGSLIY
jgi:4-amino-4-deoxy-L-arabinose transferase-like glycosyltransferase